MLTLASQSLYANFHSTNYCNDSRKQDIDDGLTNLDWLATFSCQTDSRSKLSASTTQTQHESCAARSSKPLYSYSQLICMAIKSTAEEKMTLCEIYNWIRENFSYYKQGNIQTWQNSIRHCLSTHKYFTKAGKSTNLIKDVKYTKSSYWCIDPIYSNTIGNNIFQHESLPTNIACRLSQQSIHPNVIPTPQDETFDCEAHCDLETDTLQQFQQLLDDVNLREELQTFVETILPTNEQTTPNKTNSVIDDLELNCDLLELETSDLELSDFDFADINLSDTEDEQSIVECIQEAMDTEEYLMDDESTILTGTDCMMNTNSSESDHRSTCWSGISDVFNDDSLSTLLEQSMIYTASTCQLFCEVNLDIRNSKCPSCL